MTNELANHQSLPEDFDSVRIDLELDFGNRGGLVRWNTLGELDRWISGEKKFWEWLRSEAGPYFNEFLDCITRSRLSYDELRGDGFLTESNTAHWEMTKLRKINLWRIKSLTFGTKQKKQQNKLSVY